MDAVKETSPCEQVPSTATAHQPAPKPPRSGRGAKPHVPSACTNCKKAHLACDLQRPCRRCVKSDKCDTCKDVQHKKRGRPRSKDKKVLAGSSEKSQMEGQMFQFSFTSPAAANSSSSSSASSGAQCSSVSATSVLSPASPLSHASSPTATTPVSAIASTGTTAVSSAPSAATAAISHGSLPPSPVLHRRGAVPKYPTASRAQAPLPLLSSTAEESAAAPAPAPSTPTTSYLFLTPALLCLRLEELSRTGGNALLGYSLLSLINRNVMDFMSEHDKHSVFNTFETIRQKLSSRLAQSPSRVYSHAVLGHPPPAVDPNTFQALPVDRLLQRVCADVSGNVRAHMRTAAGCYDLFDIHIYVGAVSKPPSLTAATKGVAGLTLDEVYFVCRIAKFDALSAVASSPHAASAALPHIAPHQPMFRGSIRKNSFEDQHHVDLMASQHQAKRHRVAETAANPSALYLLATVTDSSSSSASSNASDKQSNASSKYSTVSSSPMLTTPSPSLVASVPPRVSTLPPLSDLLKLLDTTGKPQQQQQQRCSLPSSFHTKSFISL
ncbi:hypothetical protein IW140_002966 [Coemansia sp. RSA 1813]|nr:hypothetical protein EV178_003829 [Coemansia sp. RSA 1646]KAJ1770606.1 hypothetical protein LPJ74_003055 [Coemansia sp. RSA 1843]KAJ2091396.1 hypothetical protein IW138_001855 [Coemansia sp. RSA 986]KAJ2212847.1 hypothetical protein EV179_004334 [Coemansia sp. RSA 487]KAJ2569558.1 hypothetical protein IW140_002966 [Coemansia sp. RSA 1813]